MTDDILKPIRKLGKNYKALEQLLTLVVENLSQCSSDIHSLKISKTSKGLRINFLGKSRDYLIQGNADELQMISTETITGWKFDSKGQPKKLSIEMTLLDIINQDFR